MGKKVVVATTGVPQLQDTSLLDDAISAVVSPLKLLSSENTTFVSERTAAMGAVGYALGGFFLGDRFGDSVPILGGRRK